MYDIVYGLQALNSSAKNGWRFVAFLGYDEEHDPKFLIMFLET